MRVGDILDSLAQRAPLDKAAGWDPVGLQIGDPDAPVRRLAVCHEVTDEVLDVLAADPVDLLVAYHPLIFRPLPRLVAGSGAEGRALRLARSGAALIAVHTAWDVAAGGAADALAEALELEDPAPFGPLDAADSLKIVTFVPAEAEAEVLAAVAGAGAARIGAYSECAFRVAGQGSFRPGPGSAPAVGEVGRLNLEPELRLEFNCPRGLLDGVLAALAAAHPYEEPAYDVLQRQGDHGFVGRIGTLPGARLADLAERAFEALGRPALRVAGDLLGPAERVAVVPGSGGDLLGAAAASGATAIVTGDVRHHPAREALDRGLGVVDPGHAPTERPGVQALYVALAAVGVEARNLADLDCDPWSEFAAVHAHLHFD